MPVDQIRKSGAKPENSGTQLRDKRKNLPYEEQIYAYNESSFQVFVFHRFSSLVFSKQILLLLKYCAIYALLIKLLPFFISIIFSFLPFHRVFSSIIIRFLSHDVNCAISLKLTHTQQQVIAASGGNCNVPINSSLDPCQVPRQSQMVLLSQKELVKGFSKEIQRKPG